MHIHIRAHKQHVMVTAGEISKVISTKTTSGKMGYTLTNMAYIEEAKEEKTKQTITIQVKFLFLSKKINGLVSLV